MQVEPQRRIAQHLVCYTLRCIYVVDMAQRRTWRSVHIESYAMAQQFNAKKVRPVAHHNDVVKVRLLGNRGQTVHLLFRIN